MRGDGKLGAETDPHSSSQAPSAAYIVMNPVFWRKDVDKGRRDLDALAAITDRHIQYHSAIGFTKHVVYVRNHDMDQFAGHPRIKKWIRSGLVMLVLWEVGLGE